MRVRGRDASEAIRSPEVNALVSRMAAVPAVREWLLSALRSAGQQGGLVADGRDIGTVVYPEAELKVFLVCDPRERALRRLREQGVAEPAPAELQAEAVRLAERDRQDSARAIAPLLRAADAVQLDTTELDFQSQVRTIAELARERAGA
jgi:cytidylate kinase